MARKKKFLAIFTVGFFRIILKNTEGDVKSIWNTMEWKIDNFSGAFGWTREMHWDRISFALN